MEPLRTLLDDSRPGLLLPAPVRDLYGGPLDLDEDVLYSNFVTSLDGVAALGVPGVSSGGAISGRNPGDRFVMGLLRAVASCVVVGASTVRDEPGIAWDADFIVPDLAAQWAALRAGLGLADRVETAIVTATGDLDLEQPVFRRHATVYTTPAGARRLDRPPATVEVVTGDQDRLDMRDVVADLRHRGHRRILTEGGPTLIGSLLEHRLLGSCFLTLSPVLAGRHAGFRPGMVHGLELLPEHGVWGRLRSLKVAGSHLFLRYDLDAG